MAERPCPACGGSRLRPESLGLKVAGRSIADVVRLTIKDAAGLFTTLSLPEREAAIARRVLKELGHYDETFGSTPQGADGDLSSYSFHMADQGTDAMERG